MLTLQEAQAVAMQFILGAKTKPRCSIAIIDARTIEREFGWVFFYDSTDYLRTGDRDKRLLGNAAVIVNRATATSVFTGTGYEVQDYIDAYEALGPERYMTEAAEYLRKRVQA